MENKYYVDKLYPLQDKVLGILKDMSENFYFTGGTALSRCYFHHRYSDDLDFFSKKDMSDFRQKVGEYLQILKDEGFAVDEKQRADTFVRCTINDILKVDFVNEKVFYYGEYKRFDLFNSVDNEMNILANKITALGRYEIKDVADIWVLAKHLKFNWEDVIAIAEKKAVIDVVLCAEVLSKVPVDMLKAVKWVRLHDYREMHEDIKCIVKDLLSGVNNSLCKK